MRFSYIRQWARHGLTRCVHLGSDLRSGASRRLSSFHAYSHCLGDVPDDERVGAYYEMVETLAEVYLEDSWVLSVDERGDALVFDLEAVLTERHALYEPPQPGERYCYRRGQLVVRSPLPISFRRSGNPPAVDASGEPP